MQNFEHMEKGQLFSTNKLDSRLTKWKEVSQKKKKKDKVSQPYKECPGFKRISHPWIKDSVKKSEKGSSRKIMYHYKYMKII